MWGLSDLFHIYTSVFMPVTHCFSYCTFVFKSESLIPPTLLFFKVNLTVHGTLEILCFRIIFPISAKDAAGILIGIALSQ